MSMLYSFPLQHVRCPDPWNYTSDSSFAIKRTIRVLRSFLPCCHHHSRVTTRSVLKMPLQITTLSCSAELIVDNTVKESFEIVPQPTTGTMNTVRVGVSQMSQWLFDIKGDGGSPPLLALPNGRAAKRLQAALQGARPRHQHHQA
jgi:hypothetical protein